MDPPKVLSIFTILCVFFHTVQSSSLKLPPATERQGAIIDIFLAFPDHGPKINVEQEVRARISRGEIQVSGNLLVRRLSPKRYLLRGDFGLPLPVEFPEALAVSYRVGGISTVNFPIPSAFPYWRVFGVSQYLISDNVIGLYGQSPGVVNIWRPNERLYSFNGPSLFIHWTPIAVLNALRNNYTPADEQRQNPSRPRFVNLCFRLDCKDGPNDKDSAKDALETFATLPFVTRYFGKAEVRHVSNLSYCLRGAFKPKFEELYWQAVQFILKTTKCEILRQ